MLRHLQTNTALALVLLAIGGCASQSQRIDAHDTPVAGDTYLYGRFNITTAGGAFGDLNMGLSITCDDGARYTLLLSRTDPLYAVRIKPAECRFKDVLFLGTGGYVESTKPVPDFMAKPRRLAPDRAYYLGDFTAVSMHVQRTFGAERSWSMRVPADKFGDTSKAFKAAFPKLANLPHENATGLGYGNPLQMTKLPMPSVRHAPG